MKPRRQKLTKYLGLVLILLIAWVAYALLRPLPAANTTSIDLKLEGQTPLNIPWPANGQAAVGTLDDGVMAQSNLTAPVSIASTAKLITALSVLKQKPFDPKTQGPTITLGPADVTLYNNYQAQDGSVVAVASGEQITEYQALQAMLLPSANNMADSLAIWAFGSMENYISFANSYAKNLGMSSTVVSDASGFSPQTTSTATDMTKLAQAVISNPVLAAISNQGEAQVPVAGTIHNTNWLLGADGVIGIKTGNTDQAGGCYVFAAQHTLWGSNITLLGSVLGDTTLTQAITDGDKIIKDGNNEFRHVYVTANQPVAVYKTAWGTTVTAVAKKDSSLAVWNAQPVKVQRILKTISGPQAAGTVVGSLQLSAPNATTSTPLVLQSEIKKPPISWRLTHLF